MGAPPTRNFWNTRSNTAGKPPSPLIDMLYGHYRQALLIKTPGITDLEKYRDQVREIAAFFKWEVMENRRRRRSARCPDQRPARQGNRLDRSRCAGSLKKFSKVEQQTALSAVCFFMPLHQSPAAVDGNHFTLL